MNYEQLALDTLWAFFAAGLFAFVFNSSKYDILWAALLGAIGWALYLVVTAVEGTETVGYLAGAFAVGFLSEVIAHIVKNPATVYVVPGILPLVPGGGMYQTMRAAVAGNTTLLLNLGLSTLTAAGAIALGVAIASSLARIIARLTRAYNVRKSKLQKKPHLPIQ